MEKLVIGACSNIDTIKRNDKISKKFLNGASIYSGFAAATKVPTRVITCVGEEKENDNIINDAKKYRNEKIPTLDVIKIRGGRSFRQTFEVCGNSFEVIDKDYGNYNDWNPKVPEYETDTLLLGTGNPIFQKSVLDSCRKANHIILDSKLIHLQVRKEKVDELIKRVDTFLGTKEEINQLLENCNLTSIMITSLFKKYPNLKVIIEKNAEKGGRVFLNDGTLYTYEPAVPENEICSDGAGDVFAGVYAAEISRGTNIKDAVKSAAQSAAESVKHFGMHKVRINENEKNIIIKMDESRWKLRDEKDTNRSYE